MGHSRELITGDCNTGMQYEGELIEMAVDSSLSLGQATVRHVELIGTS